MPPIPTVHDLRNERPGHVIGAALDRVKTVRPGMAVTLILAGEPSLLMASLNLQLRENLAWDMVEADGAWRVTVRHREDVAAPDVLALLAAKSFLKKSRAFLLTAKVTTVSVFRMKAYISYRSHLDA